MKILLISMPSIHIIRWIENIKDQNWQLFWFDILGRGELKTGIELKQYTNWKKRKIPYIKGEYFLSKKTPELYQKIKGLFQVTEAEQFESLLNEIKPDIVHSFEMQECSYPLVQILKKEKYRQIPWIYSCWGSDIYYYQNLKNHKRKILNVLGRVTYLHTDNKRDQDIAKDLGFKGENFGVYPGGGGYEIPSKEELFKHHKNIILVKGYQHTFGRGLIVIKALENLITQIDQSGLKVIVFASHPEVIEYIKHKALPFKIYSRHELSHKGILSVMKSTSIYIGNSISDGIPNTLIEAIVNGAFPIQSNPGGASEEIIKNGENGFLINDPNSKEEIKFLIMRVLSNKSLLEKAYAINSTLVRQFEKNLIKREIVKSYYKTLNQCE